jgi:uncharacterized protein (DUF1800 family)
VTNAVPRTLLDRALRPWFVVAAAAVLLAACGGGSGSNGGGGGGGVTVVAIDTTSTAGTSSSLGAARAAGTANAAADRPASLAEAARFLTQASFGPNPDANELVFKLGYSAWIDRQFALPATSHRAYWEAADAAIKLVDPLKAAGQDQVWESFWKQAATGNDQLRQRVAFALSQIFVISAVDGNIGNQPRAMADWLDMLGDKGFGTYRELLQSVSMHPMMGLYLTSLHNQKADNSGRVPDENYAREVMQLFSIGVAKLNPDGTPVLVNGNTVDTYGPSDITGMARVFTGWSWACGATNNGCFYNGSTGGVSDPDRYFKPMQAYPQFHSTEAKTFLAVTIPPQGAADAAASLKVALDTLANHPNTAPFISRQLIQRLVTSNPSPDYVLAVASVFADNGAGVRGDLKAVIKAILTHPQARVQSDSQGKVREPVLRLSAYLRAFAHTSDTGSWKVGNTDSVGTSLGQTPLRAGSVFNFYRPGYVPGGTQAKAAGLVAPEMQLLNESSASGWVNYMRDNLSAGVGQFNGTVNGVVLNRRDLQRDWSYEMALAPRSVELVSLIVDRLLYSQASAGLSNEIVTTINRIAIPALNPNGSNLAAVNAAKRNRINAAVLLTVASPEFQVQK